MAINPELAPQLCSPPLQYFTKVVEGVASCCLHPYIKEVAGCCEIGLASAVAQMTRVFLWGHGLERSLGVRNKSHEEMCGVLSVPSLLCFPPAQMLLCETAPSPS